jgi:hypothetical protein
MKKILLLGAVVAGAATFGFASACPEADFDGCTSGAYSIVETEPNEYWPHNQMEAAHRFYAHAARTLPRCHRIRLRRTHRVRYCR